MTVVSTKEFITNGEKYFNMAVNEDIRIENDKYVFHLICEPFDMIPEQVVLEPDDDLRRAIPMEQVRDSIIDYILKKYEKKA